MIYMAISVSPAFMRCFLVILVYCCSLPANAQRQATVVLKAGAHPNEVMHDSDIYLRPQFSEGLVYLKNGTVASARINYNRLYDEMQFIDASGDTLAMASEQEIRFITLGNDSFFFASGFVRRLGGGVQARLAAKQYWKITDRRKQGGYNTTSSLAASVPRGYFSAGNRMQRLNTSTELVLERATAYYFGNRNNRFLVAGKRNILALFPKLEKQITAYIKEHKPDFNNKADLEQMLTFLEAQAL